MSRVLVAFGACLVLAPLLTACGSSPTAAAPWEGEESFTVNGREMFVRCQGTGEPTVVFLHGSDATLEPTEYSRGIESELTDSHRFCSYDRPNIGKSAAVEWIPTPEEVVSDLDGVLDAVGADHPVVLLGASFGGLLAAIYAEEHPERVAGMVLLDSLFPGQLPLDDLLAQEETFAAHSADDEQNSLEHLSSFVFLSHAEEHASDLPEVPVAYFASTIEGQALGFGDEYEKAATAALESYLDRFDPGVLTSVEVPHFMEPVIPDRIADAVREVIEAGGS